MGCSAICCTKNLSAANGEYYCRIALEEMAELVKYLDQARRTRAKTFPVPKLARSRIHSERETLPEEKSVFRRCWCSIVRIQQSNLVLIWIRCCSCHLVTIAPVLSFCGLVKKDVCVEKKTQVPSEWYTHRVLKNSFVIPVGAKRIFYSQSGVTKFRISQGREHRARIKCLPLFLKLPPPFSSSLGVGRFSTCDQRSVAWGRSFQTFSWNPQ